MEEYLDQLDLEVIKNIKEESPNTYDQIPNYQQIRKDSYYSEKFPISSDDERQNDYFQSQKSSKALKEIYNSNNNNTELENNHVFRIEEYTSNNLNNKEINESLENIEKNNNSKNEENNSNFNSNEYNSGRWTNEEHNKFIEGILKYGNEWKKVQSIIKTRTSTQARSHAQKFFLRLKKVGNQEILKDENKLLNYIISTCKKTKNNFNITEEQKEKLMSVIRLNLKSEEFLNKSDKDILSPNNKLNTLKEKNDSNLDESNEEENDFLGYNKRIDNDEFGFQKKMSCDIEEKNRKETFCSRKRKSSSDMSLNSKLNKIFNIAKDKSNKSSLDLTKNNNNSIINNLQPSNDKEKEKEKEKEKNNNYYIKKFNINHNFIINKATNINESNNFPKNQIISKTIKTSDFNIKNGNIFIQNNIYNIYNNFNNNNEIITHKEINNNKCNKNVFNNDNKINNCKNTNLRTVIFNPQIKRVKNNQNKNDENQINENKCNKNEKKHLINNKNISHPSKNQENNYKLLNENEQYDPFNLEFENLFSNDAKTINALSNFKNNNFYQVNEPIQTISEKSNNVYINE